MLGYCVNAETYKYKFFFLWEKEGNMGIQIQVCVLKYSDASLDLYMRMCCYCVGPCVHPPVAM